MPEYLRRIGSAVGGGIRRGVARVRNFFSRSQAAPRAGVGRTSGS